ncbi:hypothetical protein Bca4012_016845 [Brassica carinata]
MGLFSRKACMFVLVFALVTHFTVGDGGGSDWIGGGVGDFSGQIGGRFGDAGQAGGGGGFVGNIGFGGRSGGAAGGEAGGSAGEEADGGAGGVVVYHSGIYKTIMCCFGLYT